jgi:ribosome maturation factor RimP
MDRAGGVKLEDCERVSRRLSPALDVEDLIPHRYTLEVSSPGIPRPIRKVSDFERFSGQQARIEMAVPSTGRKRFLGELAGVSSGAEPEVMLKLENGEIAHLPIDHIKRARLMMDLQ